VSEFDGKARTVLLTKEDFEVLYPSKNDWGEEFVEVEEEEDDLLDLFDKQATQTAQTPSEIDENDPCFIEALRLVITDNSASISKLQRKLSIGYSKAGKIIEKMADLGYVSEFDGKARKVLITKEQFEYKYGKF
jgi:S-DNA-T family DNA segregation ATPase FtsK/SpoIIIE